MAQHSHQDLEDALKHHAERMMQPTSHLRHLVHQPDRITRFMLKGAGLLLDFTRHRLDVEILTLLHRFAESMTVSLRFKQMVSGDIANPTESRAALHTATRSFSDRAIYVDGADVMPDLERERKRVQAFSRDLRRESILGSTGKPLDTIVVIGIGGSYLGTEFVYQALRAYAKNTVPVHFLSNVDIHQFADIVERIDIETTLWVVISKSYTTPETLANETQARALIAASGLKPERHIITVTGRNSPGDHPKGGIIDTFYMYDYIGGRYSVSSAVGGIPLSIAYGYDIFERFLKGAEEMDRHASDSPAAENLPLAAALLSYWNYQFLGYRSQAVVPYAFPLRKLTSHIQQLHMESNGKSVTADGHKIIPPAGYVIFGEPGTNAQHSFFQLAHQGQPFPIEFVGVLRHRYSGPTPYSKGITNHQELWANLVSQATALAVGKEGDDAVRYFPGNRPSSLLLIDEITPENIGRLLSFYEAKTIFEGFLWGINPFDQYGVELGKVTANRVRKAIASKNDMSDDPFGNLDPITTFYMGLLFEAEEVS